MGQAIRPNFDQYLRHCNQQRATSNDERCLPPLVRIDHLWVRRNSDRTQYPSRFSIMITIGWDVK